MPRGPRVPVGTCRRYGGDTAHGRGGGVRHRVQLVDAPADRDRDAAWGQLCPACWTAVRRFLAGRDVEWSAAPPPRQPEME